jgi:MoaA/NifB/PqqE/SkfB family radical SAM enzyme
VNLPPYVDLRPLGRCNLACPFCFGPRHGVPTMDEGTVLRIADMLERSGVRGVVISGGEPTLLPYLPRLCERLAGFADVVLSTNALAPLAVYRRILPHLAWVAVPIESADPAEHRAMRVGNAAHRDRVVRLIRCARESHPHVRIKLGTVITRLNPGAAQVLDFLDDSDLPDTWKIYELSPTSYGADNYECLSVSSGVFEDTVKRCAQAAGARGVPLAVYRNATRSGAYVLIDPDASAVVIDGGAERRIGHVLDEPEGVSAALAQHLAPQRNAANFEGTYGRERLPALRPPRL